MQLICVDLVSEYFVPHTLKTIEHPVWFLIVDRLCSRCSCVVLRFPCVHHHSHLPLIFLCRSCCSCVCIQRAVSAACKQPASGETPRTLAMPQILIGSWFLGFHVHAAHVAQTIALLALWPRYGVTLGFCLTYLNTLVNRTLQAALVQCDFLCVKCVSVKHHRLLAHCFFLCAFPSFRTKRLQ